MGRRWAGCNRGVIVIVVIDIIVRILVEIGVVVGRLEGASRQGGEAEWAGGDGRSGRLNIDGWCDWRGLRVFIGDKSGLEERQLPALFGGIGRGHVDRSVYAAGEYPAREQYIKECGEEADVSSGEGESY